MHLPIGVSDFRKLITTRSDSGEGYLFVDKSHFIKEILNDLTEVLVITRPRRFGKTLNLSMLQHFYAAEVDGKSTAGLFDGLEISKYPELMKYQGQSPVIFISLKDVKQPTFELCVEKIKSIMALTYRRLRQELGSKKLAKDDQTYIDSILNKNVDQVDLEESIQRLLELLNQVYNEQPILLIDEYDTPIQEAYLHGYYDQIIAFFRNFLSAPLKDENLLKRAILTGILRVSKESLFSSLNNVKIYSVLNDKYSQYFGFTENEVNDLLTRANMPADSKQTKEWYNGYNFGGTTVYNPWSIIEFIDSNGRLKSYWINTSGNHLVKNLIMNSSEHIQNSMRALMSGNTITEYVDEHIVFSDLDTNPAAIWSLLLMSGYLKYTSSEDKGRRYLCELTIPNKEVDDYYASVVEEWLTGPRGLVWYQEFLADLANGRVQEFEEKLQTLIEETVSYHDTTKNSQEVFYHGLMLGIVAGLRETHEVKSNKESGRGRYDVAIIPKDLNKLGIIIEFKAPQPKEQQEINLAVEAELALEQIQQSNYIAELKQRGISKICMMGIAFFKKEVRIVAA